MGSLPIQFDPPNRFSSTAMLRRSMARNLPFAVSQTRDTRIITQMQSNHQRSANTKMAQSRSDKQTCTALVEINHRPRNEPVDEELWSTRCYTSMDPRKNGWLYTADQMNQHGQGTFPRPKLQARSQFSPVPSAVNMAHEGLSLDALPRSFANPSRPEPQRSMSVGPTNSHGRSMYSQPPTSHAVRCQRQLMRVPASVETCVSRGRVSPWRSGQACQQPPAPPCQFEQQSVEKEEPAQPQPCPIDHHHRTLPVTPPAANHHVAAASSRHSSRGMIRPGPLRPIRGNGIFTDLISDPYGLFQGAADDCDKRPRVEASYPQPAHYSSQVKIKLPHGH